MRPTLLQPGDLFFTCGDSKVSKAIRWFTRDKGEPKTKASHTGGVSKGGLLSEAKIIEAVSTVQSGPLMQRYGPPKKDRFAVYRYIPMTADQAEAVVRALEGYRGRKYGYHRIAANILDFGLSRASGKNVYCFRRLAGMADYPICSWLMAYSFEKAGISFGVPVDQATPDDIWDWVVGHPSEFQQIRPMAVLY